MFQKSVFGSIALTCIMCMSLEAWGTGSPTYVPEIQKEPSCGTSPHPMRVTARHIEGKGVGYNQGYTTVEGFFSPEEPWNEDWIPFLDLRGHVFNSGKFAANAGLGFRYLTSSRVWGANAYYDYRDTNHQHYNQFAMGFESLGKIWDFRVNGYLPLGKTKSSYYRTRFDKFKGHNMYISRKREFAMKGVNAEVGAHVDSVKDYPFYFAAGPYYLEGRGHRAWGGEFRAAVDIFEYVRIEGNTSYDNIFKWIGQGQISVNIPFGGKRQVRKNENSCSTALALSQRAVQRVDRNEIIPVDTQRKTSIAIDPATGLPYFFIFVDNTSHSLGTYESPFPTLLQAQNASLPNDVIYVFPGDGTTNGMSLGITLQNGQMLLGASVSHPISTTVGNVTIPPMASTLPSIISTTGTPVQLANNNTVSGFLITTNTIGQSGMVGTLINNLNATQNTFATTATDTNGILLTDPTGTINIGSSSFNGFSASVSAINGNGIRVHLNNGGTLDTLNVSGSTFTNISNPNGNNGGNGILLNFDTNGGTLTNFTLSGSTFSGFSDNQGVYAFLNAAGSTLTNFTASGSAFSGFTGGGNCIFATLTGVGSTLANLSVVGSTFSGNSSNITGVLVTLEGLNSSMTNLSIAGSTFSDINSNSVGVFALLGATGTKLTNFSVSRSTFSGMSGGSTGVLAEVFLSSTTLTNFNVTENNFSNISDTSNGILATSSALADSGTISTMDISRNTFTGPGATANGYAASINVVGGTTCLNFINNYATPASTPTPYLFTRTGGTFNRTTESDSSTNIGQISTSGTVNPPGSCTE